MFGYKARANCMVLNISRRLEIIERECSELLLSVKNSQKLGSSLFPYIAPVIPRPLPGEVVGGKHFVLADLLKSVSGSSSQAGSAREPQAQIIKGALVSSVQPDQSPLRGQDSQATPQVVKRKKAQAKSNCRVYMLQRARIMNFGLLKVPTSLKPQFGLLKVPDVLE